MKQKHKSILLWLSFFSLFLIVELHLVGLYFFRNLNSTHTAHIFALRCAVLLTPFCWKASERISIRTALTTLHGLTWLGLPVLFILTQDTYMGESIFPFYFQYEAVWLNPGRYDTILHPAISEALMATLILSVMSLNIPKKTWPSRIYYFGPLIILLGLALAAEFILDVPFYRA